jgi:hypothetical protein
MGKTVRIEVEWLMREGEIPDIPEALQQVVEGLATRGAQSGMICNEQGWRVGEYHVAIEV